jgi:hypothetical protein
MHPCFPTKAAAELTCNRGLPSVVVPNGALLAQGINVDRALQAADRTLLVLEPELGLFLRAVRCKKRL